MDTKINYHEESQCLGHSDLNKMCELQVTVMGHPQVIVILAWANNCTPKGLPHWRPGIHWVNRLNSKPIKLCTVTTTLHTPSIPSQGLHMLSFTRKDRYPSLHSCSNTLFHSYLPQQFYFFHFPSCFWTQHLTIQQLPQGISPQMLSLGVPWLHITLQQQYMLGNKTMYKMILHAVWMKFLAPF